MHKINLDENTRKYYFGPNILESWSIWSIYFVNCKFDPFYFRLAINLVQIVNSLMENAYVRSQHTCG